MLKQAKLLILWNIIYVIFITLFFYVIFDFDIWSNTDWTRLAKSNIHGISGLAFGLSVLTFIPIYLASNFYVWKKQKFPVSLPKSKKDAEPSNEDEQISTEEELPKVIIPDYIPDELKESYIRVIGRKDPCINPDFVPNKSDDDQKLELPSDTDLSQNIMPIPESFDTEIKESSIPVFHNIDFHPTVMNPQIKIKELNGKKTAIYTFNDTSLWIADDDKNWFAEGKQIKSPISELLEITADKYELILIGSNIMNIDNLIPKWKKQGIKITIKSKNKKSDGKPHH